MRIQNLENKDKGKDEHMNIEDIYKGGSHSGGPPLLAGAPPYRIGSDPNLKRQKLSDAPSSSDLASGDSMNPQNLMLRLFQKKESNRDLLGQLKAPIKSPVPFVN